MLGPFEQLREIRKEARRRYRNFGVVGTHLDLSNRQTVKLPPLTKRSFLLDNSIFQIQRTIVHSPRWHSVGRRPLLST